jgi:hypothetical protein
MKNATPKPNSINVLAFTCILLSLATFSCREAGPTEVPLTSGDNVAIVLPPVVLGYNDLGMHCMNQDFSEFMVLPPYNTLHAQVVDMTLEPPQIVTQGLIVAYEIPGNTKSSTKTNFWTYAQSLLGVTLPPDVGLSGHGLTGTMTPTGKGDWSVTGIPLTPLTDAQTIDPFQLARITVRSAKGDVVLASTQAVVPVSWELRCDLCHHGAPDAPKSVLQAHDRLHGTQLYDSTTQGPSGGKPVLCGKCHGQPELGLAGLPNVKNLSEAMHNAHSPRMGDVVASVPGGIVCYACHPGVETPCLRDVHASNQIGCYNCHAGGTTDPSAAMDAIADPSRQPWVTEPRCGDCHHTAGHDYEQAGLLFRDSKGHGGMFCEACHGSTHAITPTMTKADNVQSIIRQGFTGPIRKCTVCHREQPTGDFVHRFVAKVSG